MTQPPKIPKTALPTSPKDRIDWLCLARSRRVGPATFIRLLHEYGNASAALDALPDIALKTGAQNYQPHSRLDAKSELERGCYAGYKPLFLGTDAYPALLAEAPDAPPFLWAFGRLECGNAPNIGIVGARNASSLGQRFAKRLASDLGEMGYIITSGLARGIDTSAHNGSLKTGTIAVTAGGIDQIYPAENKKLEDDISKSGLLLSEQPLGLSPQARHFPQRNRIIAGLSQGLVVVEGALRSGSLITARAAGDLGRDVFAVPGHPMDARAAGCNVLIRDGAYLIRSAQDVHDAFETPRPRANAPEAPVSVSPQQAPSQAIETKILSILSSAAQTEDLIIRDCGFPPEHVNQSLITLELTGKIQRRPGGLLGLAS